MKLLYLLNQRMPTEKAYGIQVVSMCEAFSDFRINVILAYPKRNNKIRKSLHEYYATSGFHSEPINSFDLPYWLPGWLDRIAFWIKNQWSARKLVDRAVQQKADIYYCRDELVALELVRRGCRPTFEIHRFSDRRIRLYEKLKGAGVKFVVISKGLGKALLDIGVKSDNILVAPDGAWVLPEQQIPDIGRARTLYNVRELNLSKQDKVIVYAGHLFDWKGADVLAQVALSIKNIIFIFVGGTDADVAKFRAKYGNHENIRIIGHIQHALVEAYLYAADALVLPNKDDGGISTNYTSPLKMFEYMAAKRPIVASDLPSIREVLNEDNAVLVKPGDPAALAEGIKRILGDRPLGEKLAEKAYKDVQEYTWQKRAGHILDFIQSR